ncbi:MAG: hypothetical protein Tsb0034_13300 [Ekhidna sp.]
MAINAAIIVLLIGIPILVKLLADLRFGLYIIILISVAMPIANRVLPGGYIPFGVFIDLLLLLIFGIIMARSINNWIIDPDNYKLSNLSNPISVLVMIWVAYWMIQVFNPAGTVGGWVYGIRSVIRMMIIYFIIQSLLNTPSHIKRFTDFFIIIGLLAGLYGIYQEFFGLPSFDMKWATATEERIGLLYIGGKWRKFSFMTDPSAFGLFMAFISIMTAFLSIGPNSTRRRVFYLVTCIVCLMGMLYSGIRTAFAVVPVAVFLYVLLNINKTKTLAFAGFSALFFVVIYFGPFYGKTIMRFRSAFNPGEDASMQVRDVNRERIQPYIYDHPFGGGLTTTGSYGIRYSPGHPLAGFPPDSGFMKILLELGWVGLLLEMILFSVVLGIGISNYYACSSEKTKAYMAAYIVGFFAMTIAYYAKKGVDQFPINFLLYSTFAIVRNLKFLEKEKSPPNYIENGERSKA